MTTKRCSGCDQTKPLEDFYKRSAAKDGRQARCRECMSTTYKKWYADNAETHQANMAAVRLTQRSQERPSRVCATCGETFYPPPTRRNVDCGACVNAKNRLPCPLCGNLMSGKSKSCSGCVDQGGCSNGNWKGGVTRHSSGYVMVLVDGTKYRAEHQIVMEAHLGRPLEPGENVHHLNTIRCDNRIENLELWTKGQPSGARAVDILAWAREMVARYEPLEQDGLI